MVHLKYATQSFLFNTFLINYTPAREGTGKWQIARYSPFEREGWQVYSTLLYQMKDGGYFARTLTIDWEWYKKEQQYSLLLITHLNRKPQNID